MKQVSEYSIKKELLAKFNLLATGKNPRDFAAVSGLIEKIFDKKTLSYEISYGDGGLCCFSLPESAKFDENWLVFLRSIDKVLTDRGYRNSTILTVQEHKMMGSSPPNIDEPDKAEKYVPIALISGEMKYEEVVKARRLKAISRPRRIIYKNGEALGNIVTSLESLDRCGNTIRDARVLDMAKFSSAIRNGVSLEIAYDGASIRVQKSDMFPYPRS